MAKRVGGEICDLRQNGKEDQRKMGNELRYSVGVGRISVGCGRVKRSEQELCFITAFSRVLIQSLNVQL